MKRVCLLLFIKGGWEDQPLKQIREPKRSGIMVAAGSESRGGFGLPREFEFGLGLDLGHKEHGGHWY